VLLAPSLVTYVSLTSSCSTSFCSASSVWYSVVLFLHHTLVGRNFTTVYLLLEAQLLMVFLPLLLDLTSISMCNISRLLT